MSHAEVAGGAPDCAEVSRWIEPYVDGEFGALERGELELHLGACASCSRQARQIAALKAGLKAASPRPALPEGMRERLVNALAATPLPGEEQEQAQPRWRRTAIRVAPAAAAVALVGTLLGSWHRVSPVSEDAIAQHRRRLPYELATSNVVEASNWVRPKVDFAVRPAMLPSGQLVGVRVGNILDRQAAYLMYNVSGSPVSVFVFDPANLPIDARHRRVVGGRDIFLDEKSGYHVALVRNGGVGYAFASELDEESMFQLVSAAFRR